MTNTNKLANLLSSYTQKEQNFVLRDILGRPAQASGRTESGVPINVDYVGGTQNLWYGPRKELDKHLDEIRKAAENRTNLGLPLGETLESIDVLVIPEGTYVTPKPGVVVVHEPRKPRQH